MFGLLAGVEVVERAEELVEAVSRGQRLVGIAEMVLAELRGRVAPALSNWAMVTSRACKPSFAPGRPTLRLPVRRPTWPVMKAERPAVQLCCPYQSVNSAPFLAMLSMAGVL
jgi:hypothetical protein